MQLRKEEYEAMVEAARAVLVLLKEAQLLSDPRAKKLNKLLAEEVRILKQRQSHASL